MSILVNSETRLLVQGITGDAAQHHTLQMLTYGTNIVAGMRPGAGGQVIHGIEVFDSVAEAKKVKDPNTSILFVPAKAMKQAAFEAIDANIKLIVMVSEHVPLHDTLEIIAYSEKAGVNLIGPNTPGLISPSLRCKIGFVPANYYLPGPVGVASRSGTLTYEIVSRLTVAGIGQSTCVGIGGDPINGTNFIDTLMMFQEDPDTEKIVLIGEIGGTDEEQAAAYISEHVTKPVSAFIAGRTAPPGKRMGHAGAIVQGGTGLAEDKIKALENARVKVAQHPEEIPSLL